MCVFVHNKKIFGYEESVVDLMDFLFILKIKTKKMARLVLRSLGGGFEIETLLIIHDMQSK